MERDGQWTPEQKKALDEGAAALTVAFEQVTAQLAAVGLDSPPELGEGSFRCRRCDCEFFKQPRRPLVACARTSCGHSFGEHFVR